MRSSVWTFILGILMLIAGILALINPFPVSLTVVIFAAWSFIVLGVLLLVSAFSHRGGGRTWLILVAAVMIWIGFVLRGNPIEALITLTVVVALSFLVSGFAKVILGWTIRSMGLGGGVLLSGVLSVALGIMLLANILGAAPWVLGTLLGIELVSDGVAILAVWHSTRNG